MEFVWIIVCVLTGYTTCFAQHLKILPEKPSVNDSVLIEYDPAFFGDTPFQCRVYFSGISSDEREFPRVSEITLIKNGNLWRGVIAPIPVRTTSMVLTFFDSLNQRDLNNGNGYWSHFYENGEPVPGSWAGIGDLLYGNWITKGCPFHLGENLDSANAFFKRELVLHPEVKHAYMRQYLASFKTGTPETNQQLLDELAYFSSSPALSESNLLTLKFEYARLKDTLNANRHEREIFTSFPNGSWTPQAKSLPLLIRLGSSRDFNEQVKIYQEFKKSFLKTYETSFGTLTMNNRAGRMLGYMVAHFSEERTMNLWKNEVLLLTDEGKITAYREGSKKLMENAQFKVKISSAQIENKFYQFNLNQDQYLKDAEDLAMLAISVWNKNADGPPKQNESNLITRNEVAQLRNNQLSRLIALHGSTLLQQNKIQEAVTALKEAVIKSKYTEPETNELYIEALVKSGNIHLALSEARKIIALEKSTQILDEFFAKTEKNQNDLTSLKEENLEKDKVFVAQKLIREKSPDYTAYDLSGKSIPPKSLKNKIVVITFWASWCPPCIIELKSVDAVVKKFKDDPEVVFLTVNEDDVRDRAMKVINEYTIQNHFTFDEKRKMLYALGANSLPAQVIIDKKGEIRFRTGGLHGFDEQENTSTLQAMISVLKASN